MAPDVLGAGYLDNRRLEALLTVPVRLCGVLLVVEYRLAVLLTVTVTSPTFIGGLLDNCKLKLEALLTLPVCNCDLLLYKAFLVLE